MRTDLRISIVRANICFPNLENARKTKILSPKIAALQTRKIKLLSIDLAYLFSQAWQPFFL